MAKIRMRAILPKKRPLDPKEYARAEREAREKSARRVRDQLQRTARTWKKKPKFTVYTRPSPGGYVRIIAGTDNRIWGYIDKGTPTRYIVAKRKPFLRFRVPYGAKTTPGVLTSRSGFVGQNWVSKKRVKHKIRARKFSVLIAKQERPRMAKDVQRAFADVARKAR